MSTTGGKAYLMVLEDILELAQSADVSSHPRHQVCLISVHKLRCSEFTVSFPLQAGRAGGVPRAGLPPGQDAVLHELRAHRPRRHGRRAAPALQGTDRSVGDREEKVLWIGQFAGCVAAPDSRTNLQFDFHSFSSRPCREDGVRDPAEVICAEPERRAVEWRRADDGRGEDRDSRGRRDNRVRQLSAKTGD